VSEVEPWLEQRGHLQRRGEPADTINNDNFGPAAG
jgi:hypothetical protein